MQNYPGTGNEGGHPLPSQESEKTDSDGSRWVIFRESLGSTVPLPENIRSLNSEFCMTILERPGPILIQWCFLRGEKERVSYYFNHQSCD
jgi:hypothetical protein